MVSEGERFFEDYEIGSSWETHGRTIGEADIIIHAGHSGDFFPHHMDAEWAKGQSFGQRIAHGTMTFTIGIGLTATKINPVAFTYGFDRLRYPRPVHIGDTIHTRVTVISAENDTKRPAYGRVVEKCEVINQRGEVVMACDHVLLALLRSNTPEKDKA